MIKISLATIIMLFSFLAFAQGNMNNQSMDSFTDKIRQISNNEKDISVRFAKHAAIYKILKSNPHFEELKTKLEKLKKEKKEVKIVVNMQDMEIKNVTE